MKYLKQCKSFLLIGILFASINLSGQENNMKNFATAEEAANQGKVALLEVLNSGRDLNLGVNAEELKSSKVATPISKRSIDFDKVLNLSSENNLREAVSSKDNGTSIVPFVMKDQVATVVEVANSAEGWKVIGLAGMSVSKDLTDIMKVTGTQDISIYEVPNLNTVIYTTKGQSGEVYFTTYNGHSIRQAYPKSELFSELEADAKKFKAEFGDQLEKGMLVE